MFEESMQRLPLKSVSILFAAIVVYFLQVIPVTGVFLMMLGGPALTGILINAFFIALFFEARRERIPSWLMGVPVIAIGLYYGFYLQEMWDGYKKNEALLEQNPKLVLQYDSSKHSLVDTELVIEKYAVPVMYQPWGPEGEYRALRLLPHDLCNTRGIINNPKTPDGKTRLCVLGTKEQPPKSLIEVKRVLPSNRFLRPEYEETIELRENGTLRGVFKTIHTTRLSPIPLFAAGCALDSGAPAWRCFRDFMRLPIRLDGYGAYWTDAEKDRPEAVMLGFRKYADEELNNYRGHPETDPIFAR
jgi:hypothetical protein